MFAGDHDALVDIVRHCHADLLRRVRLAIKSIGDNSLACRLEAIDLCQQIYLSLWTRRRRPLPVRNVEAYVHTLIRNVLRSELRTLLAARRGAGYQPYSMESLEASNGKSAERGLLGRRFGSDYLECADEVETLLSRLEEPERRLTRLVLDGLNWQEIAARLPDAPQAAHAARMRFHRLAARLRQRHGSDDKWASK